METKVKSQDNVVLISIIIPAFNRGGLIKETIDSILTQRFAAWEVIVVDDHSSDNTMEIVQNMINKDRRINFFTRPDYLPKGANSCRNFGLSKSKGQFIKWLDSDDILVPDSLCSQAKILMDDCRINVCLGYSQFFNGATGELEKLWSRNNQSDNLFSDHIVNKIRWGVGGPLWRKSWLKINPYCNTLKNSQEWLMHSVSLLLLDKRQIYNYTDVVCYVRRGHDRMSSSRSSLYYLNQVKARLILLSILVKTRIVVFSDMMQLAKQSMVYGGYAVVRFLSGDVK